MNAIELHEDLLEDCAPEGIATPPVAERLHMLAPLAFAGTRLTLAVAVPGADSLVAERQALTRTQRIVEMLRSI